MNRTYYYLIAGACLILAAALISVTASHVLSDAEMSAIDARSVGAVSSPGNAGRGEVSVATLGAGPRTAEEAFDFLLTFLDAELLSSVLDYDMSVGPVVYGYGTEPVVNSDGTLTFPLPSRIDYVHLERLRPAGADPNQSFGDVEINNIQLGRNSAITIQPMPDP